MCSAQSNHKSRPLMRLFMLIRYENLANVDRKAICNSKLLNTTLTLSLVRSPREINPKSYL